MTDAIEIFKSICHSSTIFTFTDEATRLIAGSQKHLAIEANKLLLQMTTNSQTHPHVLVMHSVEMAGFEPATFALQRRCSPTELHPQV